MIATANLEKYRNGDFIQFVNNVLQLLPENVATNLQVATQRAELQNLALQFQDAFKPVSGNELTPEIEALDKQRDEALTGIRYLLDAYNHHYNDALRNNQGFVGLAKPTMKPLLNGTIAVRSTG